MNTELPDPVPQDPPVVRHPGKPKKPGALRGQVWLTVQTRQAQQLIHGRAGTPGKAPIIGLVGFADRLRIIWEAARHDDPWADWWLIKVCDAIDATGDTIRRWKQDLDHLLALEVCGLEVAPAESLRPCRTPLQFANPYAYQGAHLLSEYDALACQVLTASHIGLLDNRTRDDLLGSCAQKIRATFMVPQDYRLTGIDREALRDGHGESRRACQVMGEVPDEVVRGERHAPLVPRTIRPPAALAEDNRVPPASHSTETGPAGDEPAGRDNSRLPQA